MQLITVLLLSLPLLFANPVRDSRSRSTEEEVFQPADRNTRNVFQISDEVEETTASAFAVEDYESTVEPVETSSVVAEVHETGKNVKDRVGEVGLEAAPVPAEVAPVEAQGIQFEQIDSPIIVIKTGTGGQVFIIRKLESPSPAATEENVQKEEVVAAVEPQVQEESTSVQPTEEVVEQEVQEASVVPEAPFTSVKPTEEVVEQEAQEASVAREVPFTSVQPTEEVVEQEAPFTSVKPAENVVEQESTEAPFTFVQPAEEVAEQEAPVSSTVGVLPAFPEDRLTNEAVNETKDEQLPVIPEENIEEALESENNENTEESTTTEASTELPTTEAATEAVTVTEEENSNETDY